MTLHQESQKLIEIIVSLFANLGLWIAGFLTLILICKAIVAVAGAIVGIANLL